MNCRVIVLRSPRAQELGVIPYQEGGLDSRTVFFFPHIGSTLVSGVGMTEGIRLYALDENLNFVDLPPFDPIVIVQPRHIFHLPPVTRHVVETALGAPKLNDFEFLRKHL